jgi:hypothetical protein
MTATSEQSEAATAADPANDRVSTATSILGVILLSVILLCITGLLLANRDVSQLVYFATGSVLPFGALMLLGKRLDGLRTTAAANRDDIQSIGTAVNGKLDAKFAEIHQRLDGLGAPTTPALQGGLSQRQRDVGPGVQVGPGVFGAPEAPPEPSSAP